MRANDVASIDDRKFLVCLRPKSAVLLCIYFAELTPACFSMSVWPSNRRPIYGNVHMLTLTLLLLLLLHDHV